MKTLLLDALYINNSGGKILLDYLIDVLEQSDIPVCYLLDKRIENQGRNIKKSNPVYYVEASLVQRHRFYKMHSISFNKVLCFGNLPPTIRLSIPVFTYFHQKLFISVPDDVPVSQKLLLRLKTKIFKFLQPHTDYWLVQTDIVKEDFTLKFSKIIPEKVLLMPFYPQIKVDEVVRIIREKHCYVYVSNGSPHKNHVRLLNAFIKFYNTHQLGELHLTVGNEFPGLITTIRSLQSQGYPIINHGFIAHSELAKIYKKAEYLIFPSLSESFGLGLIEAIENGCKVIGADIPYTFAVCNPSIIFDPLKVDDIVKAFEKTLEDNTRPTEQLVFNKINELIKILTN